MSANHITVTVDAADAANIIEQYADEVRQIVAQRDELLAACIQTVEENGHLADGENCTLIHLVRAIAKVKGEKT